MKLYFDKTFKFEVKLKFDAIPSINVCKANWIK